MFKRLEDTILKAIDEVFEESVCVFEDWWKDDFETDIYIENEEDLKTLSADELEIAKSDWIQWVADGFAYATCKEFGIDTIPKTHNQEVLIEEIYEIVKEQLWKELNK